MGAKTHQISSKRHGGHKSMAHHKETARAKSAAIANLAKARRVEASRPKTARQKASSAANLAKGRARDSAHHTAFGPSHA